MILYVDSSALVKLLVSERHSDEVSAWAQAADAVATSAITLAETMSAVSRRWRIGDLTQPQADRTRSRLWSMWSQMMHIGVDEQRAARLAWQERLRGMDAVQLAAALALRDAVGGGDLAFSSFDERLNAAALSKRLIVLSPDY